MIKINFEFETQHGIYRDAVHLPDDHAYTEAQIDAMKQERLNNWLNIVENPSEPVEE